MNAYYIGPLSSMWESKGKFSSWNGAGYFVHYSRRPYSGRRLISGKGGLLYISMLFLLSYDISIVFTGERKLFIPC